MRTPSKRQPTALALVHCPAAHFPRGSYRSSSKQRFVRKPTINWIWAETSQFSSHPDLVGTNPQHGTRQLELADRLPQGSTGRALIAVRTSYFKLLDVLSRGFRMRDEIPGAGKTR